MKRKPNRIETIEKIETSFVNGSITQAKEQIAEALEAGANPLDYNFEYFQEGLEQFINQTVIKYLANTPTLTARQTLLAW
jgi:hypothetical protein